MKIDLSQFRETFLQESADHIAAIESGLLELRSRPEDTELLNAIFRSAHSIKGGAGSFGLGPMAQFTHELENLLDRLRAAEIAVSDEIIALLLECTDVLRALLDPKPAGETLETARRLAQRIVEQTGNRSGAADPERADTKMTAEAGSGGTLSLYQVEFRPDRELFSSGTNPIVLLRNLAALGDVSVTRLHADDLPSLAELDTRQCYLSWTVEMVSDRGEEDLRGVFEFVEHLAEIRIRRLDANSSNNPESVLAPSEGAKASGAEPHSPSHAGVFPSAARESRAVRPAVTGESSSIRVATEKVDRLIDLVGELVIAHVMTAQMVEDFTPGCLPKLRASVAAMERNTRELHERVMAIRMLPVGTLFHRYARMVYDIAQATGKQIELAMAGEETEIDKSMLELLGDPLTHLIRNAADHGIETVEARLSAGKAAGGMISLRAFHRAGRVVIEVQDDGAGIDPAAVRARAVERGLISADAQLTDEQLRLLVFEPGFSTRDQASDFSGRGVGMDVVKQNVQQLNGAVTLSSEVGRGSIVSIELPLTLAILEGLLVRVADRTLVLPLLSVLETVSPRPDQIQRIAEQGEVVVIRNETVPLVRLRRFLRLASAEGSTSAPRSLVVVVEAGRKKLGLEVDELLGQQQVVVKSLEQHLRKVDGLMGATILGDGCVAPIVDVASLAGLNLCTLYLANRTPPDGGGTARIIDLNFQSEERGETSHAMV